jgi:hypothetical protein
MKKLDVAEFLGQLREELDNFEHYQISYTPTAEKTYSEWADSFMKFAGIGEDEVDEEYDEELEEYDDEYGYVDSHYEELVNRRKYRSFRDDDSY